MWTVADRSMMRGTTDTCCVAMLTPSWPAGFHPNGIVSYTARQRHALEQVGAKVYVISERPGEDEPNVVRLQGSMTNSPWQRLQRWMQRRRQGDVAQFHQLADVLVEYLWQLHETHGLQLLQMPDTFGLARFVAPRSPVPVVVRLHGPWFLNGSVRGDEPDQRYHQRVEAEGLGIAAAHAVTAPSQSVLDRTRQHYAMDLADAAVIANPIPVPAPDDLWRLADCRPRRLLFVGRFDRHKGADLMLQAFAELHRKFDDLQLQLVGPDRGLIDDAGRTWHLPDYLSHHLSEPARRAVQILGEQPQDKLDALRRSALVTVVPSRYETFGNTALEAMSSGCPVVVAETGGLAEIVTDGVTGRTFAPGDATALAAVLGELIQDEQQMQALGHQAHRHVRCQYAPDQIAERTMRFFDRVLERAATAGREGVTS